MLLQIGSVQLYLMTEPTCVQFVIRAYMFSKPLRHRTNLLTGPLKVGHIYLLSLKNRVYLLVLVLGDAF